MKAKQWNGGVPKQNLLQHDGSCLVVKAPFHSVPPFHRWVLWVEWKLERMKCGKDDESIDFVQTINILSLYKSINKMRKRGEKREEMAYDSKIRMKKKYAFLLSDITFIYVPIFYCRNFTKSYQSFQYIFQLLLFPILYI